jgi:nucleobase transporter 1/2
MSHLEQYLDPYVGFSMSWKLTGNLVMIFRENVGLLGLTRVGSRRVVQISAGFMIFFSILGLYYLLRHEYILGMACGKECCAFLVESMGSFNERLRCQANSILKSFSKSSFRN